MAVPLAVAGAGFTAAGVAAGLLAAWLQVLTRTCIISLFFIINNGKIV